MPSFHTKTIESILDPVSQQVSRLVILHEEAEDGNEMPDLERPVQGVSKAVANLVNVGRETINSSDDHILKQDMPHALSRVEQASRLLEDASTMLKNDPFSQPARRKLIEGSRGILQGTSLLLNTFDESEVRKIIKECKQVLEFISVAEVIDTMEDLVKFVQNLSPCLTKVSREVDYRVKELTHQVHREMLARSLESLKSMAPMLICSMKMCVQLAEQRSKNNDALENRVYLATRMSEELNEIIRVLQLTTYEEDSWESDDMNKLKKAQQAISSKLSMAHDWLEDPSAVTGGVGERSVRNILDIAKKIAEMVNPEDRDQIRKIANDIEAMVNALCELRNEGRGDSPQAHSLGRAINNKLQELNNTILRAIQNKERQSSSVPGTAATVSGKFEQANKWLGQPGFDDGGLGAAAVDAITRDCRRIAQNCPSAAREDINNLCNEIEHLSKQLSDLVRRGMGNTPQAQEIARRLQSKLQQLKRLVDRVLITRVVDDFIDIYTPLKQFTEAVNSPQGTPNREANFQDKAQALVQFTSKCAATARNVASGLAPNKRLAEAIFTAANEVESVAPQLTSAGRIRFQHPENGSAGEHYENLRAQTQENLEKLRSMVDEAVDSVGFVQASEEAMQRYTALCENAIAQRAPLPMVENTSNIARLANRVLGVAKQEAENSEDAAFISKINQSADALQRSIPTMVQDAKQVAMNINDPGCASRWRDSNRTLIRSVSEVKEALTPPAPDLSKLSINDDYSYVAPKPRAPVVQPKPKINENEFKDIISSLDGFVSEPKQAPMAASAPVHYHNHYTAPAPARADSYAPPRPPPPSGNDMAPPRPPLPTETDDEYEVPFPTLQPNQPIMMAAHELHQEVRQWSSKENEIIAAAKRMAIHMARLSALCGGQGTKKDLIACAKLIAETSEEVTRLAKEQAKLCTDKRMRTNILQVCERIPTIGTQLRILSTVKATLLGAQGSQEDQEATEMLVGNAQNLMQSARETVRACEAASIKIRTESGCQVSWIRKQPWYQ